MAYTYIERAYGRKFEAGQRVRFTEYKGERGDGVVRSVRGDPQYVRVLFDDGHEGDCHPGSVEIVPVKSSD
jgi:RNase P/RNase MRP subunit POP5